MCSLIRTSDFVALGACDAYSSETSLKKVLTLDKAKKNVYFYCYVLTFSYLCTRKSCHRTMPRQKKP